MNQIELESLDEATLMPDVPKTLKTLKEKNLKIGILTNSCRRYAETILAKFGIEKYVDAVAARDDVNEPKPNPEHAFFILRLLGASVEESLFIGDHWLDAECAKISGLKFILLRSQKQNSGLSLEYKCQVIDNIKDIIGLVKNTN
jgi:HAD superfamily hydrolase (TIGR01549 family)